MVIPACPWQGSFPIPIKERCLSLQELQGQALLLAGMTNGSPFLPPILSVGTRPCMVSAGDRNLQLFYHCPSSRDTCQLLAGMTKEKHSKGHLYLLESDPSWCRQGGGIFLGYAKNVRKRSLPKACRDDIRGERFVFTQDRRDY